MRIKYLFPIFLCCMYSNTSQAMLQRVVSKVTSFKKISDEQVAEWAVTQPGKIITILRGYSDYSKWHQEYKKHMGTLASLEGYNPALNYLFRRDGLKRRTGKHPSTKNISSMMRDLIFIQVYSLVCMRLQENVVIPAAWTFLSKAYLNWAGLSHGYSNINTAERLKSFDELCDAVIQSFQGYKFDKKDEIFLAFPYGFCLDIMDTINFDDKLWTKAQSNVSNAYNQHCPEERQIQFLVRDILKKVLQRVQKCQSFKDFAAITLSEYDLSDVYICKARHQRRRKRECGNAEELGDALRDVSLDDES